MNYYEKLIQEKNNARDYDDINKVYKEAKRIVDDLRRKYSKISSRERDDGNFLYSIIEEKGMPTDSGDQQKAKHAAGLLESVRRMSTTPRDWGNSKGETKMGYYEDLIKQKQEKRNFRADPLGFGPTVVGMGTPDDYKAKFKVGDKVKFYSGEGVIVKGPIKMRFSLTPTYHIKVTAGKEAGREVSRYEEELKKNSKEEKDNDAEGRLMEIAEKVLREYPESTKSYAKFEDRFLTKAGWGYNPSKVKTIKEIWERVANSKKEEGYYAKLAEEKASRKH